MSIVFFEDTSWKNFVPLSYTRSLFDIKIGSLTTFEHFNTKSAKFLTRQYLEKVTHQRHPDCDVNKFEYNNDDIFINSLFIPCESFLKKWTVKKDFLLCLKGKILMGKLKKSNYEYLYESIVHDKVIDNRKLSREMFDIKNIDKYGTLYSWPWDIITHLRDSLCDQLGIKNKIAKGAKVIGKNPVYVDKNSKIDEGTVLDASNGGIYVGPQSIIHRSSIYGPVYLGSSCQVKPYSIINNSYIGNNCRIGGEIDSSVILDYSNKTHLGYLGHSYVGEWVNIGANTITSDLKMTYGTISMKTGNEKKDTKTIKLGSFLGDMAKTSIGTNIYCGLKIGVSSHVYGNIVNDVPSYVIYGQGVGSENAEMDLSLAIKFQKRMMSRRNVNMSLPYESMLRVIYDMTADERRECGVRKKRFTL
jgi:UDP-N-acetylglucosamine diphosphorylase/glucosamine-1-phosphate N-acetyltransferase